MISQVPGIGGGGPSTAEEQDLGPGSLALALL